MAGSIRRSLLEGAFFLVLWLAAWPSCLGAAASGSGLDLQMRADASGDTRVVNVWADHLEYYRDQEMVVGEGHVVVKQGDVSLFAGQASLDLHSNRVRARDDVLWSQGGQEVHADRIEVDMKSGSGKAEGIHYYKSPWIAGGGRVEKKGEKEVEISDSAFTTCDRESPHYRLVARRIRIVLDESLSAANVVAYVGRVPVLYIPYFSRNLKDPRPPFLVRPGSDQAEGVFVKTTVNYYLSESQYGSVQFDWMQKLGTGEGLTHHYKLPGGRGEAGGYYARDKNTGLEHWTGHFGHSQDFGRGYSLLGNLDMLSDATVNNAYSQSRVDSYQRHSYLSFQSSQADYAWNAQLSDTRVLEPFGDSLTGLSYREVVVERRVPSLRYDLFARPLFAGANLYRSLGASFDRSYLEGTTATAGAYLNRLALSPTLLYDLVLPRRNSLSVSLTADQALLANDQDRSSDTAVTVLSTRQELQTRWRRGITTHLSHDHSRQVSHPESLPFSGLLTEHAGVQLDGSLRDSLQVILSGGIDLRPFRVEDELQRLDLATLQAGWNPPYPANATLLAAYHVATGQLKSVDAGFNVSERDDSWQFSLSGSWVSNRIVRAVPRPEDDPHAPARVVPVSMDALGISSPLLYFPPQDVFRIKAGSSFKVGEKWRLTLTEGLNLATRKVDEGSVSVWRDLHCWEAQFSVGQRLDGSPEFGFTLMLKAFPQFKATSASQTGTYGLQNFGL